MSWFSNLLRGGRRAGSSGTVAAAEQALTKARGTVFVELGPDGYHARESRLIRPQSKEERKEFGEAVCRQVGDRFKNISFNMNDGTTVCTYVYGVKDAYMAVAGEGRTLVYDENRRELLADIDGLIFPGTQ